MNHSHTGQIARQSIVKRRSQPAFTIYALINLIDHSLAVTVEVNRSPDNTVIRMTDINAALDIAHPPTSQVRTLFTDTIKQFTALFIYPEACKQLIAFKQFCCIKNDFTLEFGTGGAPQYCMVSTNRNLRLEEIITIKKCYKC